MQKVKFKHGRFRGLMGFIAGIPCLLKGSGPRAGETWLVEITGKNVRGTMAYVRAVRPWHGTPEDLRAVVHARMDFRQGTVRLADGFAFPAEGSIFAQQWEDYRVLIQNTAAVIIRADQAVRWRKKGKPPQVLPLHRFATKYKRQPLLGEQDDIRRFLANLEDLGRKTVEDARAARGMVLRGGKSTPT